jgi:hypothetical protein
MPTGWVTSCLIALELNADPSLDDTKSKPKKKLIWFEIFKEIGPKFRFPIHVLCFVCIRGRF